MEDFTFDDFLSVAKLRNRFFTIEGIGRVKIYELSSLDIAKIREEAREVNASGDLLAHGEFVARNACRFLNGGDYPSDDQITGIRRNVSEDVLIEIYSKGMNFNFAGSESKEVIEKNS